MQFATRLRTWLLEGRRVLAVTRKPTREELSTIVKVTGIGILFIGLIGFLLQMGQKLLF
jgi:protein transport protein SEC61 subunit gamma and related proteins